MKNYPVWIANILLVSLFIWFLKWNSTPEEQVIVVKNITQQTENVAEQKTEELETQDVEEDKEEEIVNPEIFMSSIKNLEQTYLKMENERLQLENSRLNKELLSLKEEKAQVDNILIKTQQSLTNLSQQTNSDKTQKEKLEKIIKDTKANVVQTMEEFKTVKAKLEQEVNSKDEVLKKTQEEKDAVWALFNKEKERMESDFLKKVEIEVQARIKTQEEKKQIKKVEPLDVSSLGLLVNKQDKKEKVSWNDMWSKVLPAGQPLEMKEFYADNLQSEHKKILQAAYQEKIVEKVLWLHDQLSNSRKQLKSSMVNEVEMVKKEDDYSQTTDFLLSTGDRYIIVSLSIPLDPAPYQEGKEETFWVTAKVFDLDSEVLRFQLKLKNNQPTTEEIISYIPGDWTKIIRSFK